MNLSIADKLTASVAMLHGDSFTLGNATIFPFSRPGEYCVLQMIGPADKCKRIVTKNWNEAIKTFEEYAKEE